MKVGPPMSNEEFSVVYGVRAVRLAQNAMRQQGEAAVRLIESTNLPPVGPDGQGSRINTYA
jgi:hypothetical protein